MFLSQRVRIASSKKRFSCDYPRKIERKFNRLSIRLINHLNHDQDNHLNRMKVVCIQETVQYHVHEFRRQMVRAFRG